MVDFTPDEATKRVGDAISEALGELVTNWVLTASSITDEGDQATWHLRSDGQPDWVTLGLLNYAAARVQNTIGVDED